MFRSMPHPGDLVHTSRSVQCTDHPFIQQKSLLWIFVAADLKNNVSK